MSRAAGGDGRAAVVAGPQVAEIVDAPVRAPGADEVLVSVAGCGVCGSDLPLWEGRPWFSYPRPPGTPGHEAWGVVADVGADVRDVRPGDPVAVVTSGGFATSMTVAAGDVVVIPDDLRGAVFPGEAIGCGFNVARRSGFGADVTVAVIGIGYLGAIVTRLAARAGARVIAVSRRRSSLELARRMGADETVVAGDDRHVLDVVESATSGRLCDVVVEAVGAQQTLDLSTTLTGVGGRLVIAGYHQESPRTVDVQLWNWRGIDVVNAHERDPEVVRRGVREAAAAVVDGWFDPAPLHTTTFGLEDLGRALDVALEHPEGFVKSLVLT